MTGCALALAPLAVGLTACSGSDQENPLASAPYDAGDQVALEAGNGGGTVDPSKPLTVTAKGGEGKLSDVTAVDTAGRFVGGRMSADGTRWTSTRPLAAGARYTVRVSTENDSGKQGRRTLTFSTRPADARKLGVTFGPDAGTYGVGQPLTAELSHRVDDPRQRAIVEGALQVTSKPAVNGSWHWVDGKELHFRPRTYWPAHTRITAHARLSGLKIRKGLYGGKAEPLHIRTGDRVEAFADAGAKKLRLVENGRELRTIPITTGKAGFETRTGTKVILGREAFVRMRSSTVGIGGGDSYDLPVHWATRLTWSGEYVHAAPWSVGSQGVANVSHGCTGMSMENAHWFFDHVRPGDLVHHTHTGGDRMAGFGNGFGDWNLSWEQWQKGSALHGGGDAGAPGQSEEARLRPQL